MSLPRGRDRSVAGRLQRAASSDGRLMPEPMYDMIVAVFTMSLMSSSNSFTGSSNSIPVGEKTIS